MPSNQEPLSTKKKDRNQFSSLSKGNYDKRHISSQAACLYAPLLQLLDKHCSFPLEQAMFCTIFYDGNLIGKRRVWLCFKDGFIFKTDFDFDKENICQVYSLQKLKTRKGLLYTKITFV